MLRVSEQFYSIQGEGISVGTPCVFLRLTGCNLSCGGVHTIKSKALDSGATWRCDTIEVWTKGQLKATTDIISEWRDLGWLNRLNDGAHLVITGGEPLLQDAEVSAFLDVLEQAVGRRVYVEIETNGTCYPSKNLDSQVSQYNVSPKIENSGMRKKDRLKPAVLSFFSGHESATFKCVVSSLEDIMSYQEQIIGPFSIPASRVLLMPAAETRAQLSELELAVVSWCLQFGYRFSPRYHLHLWDLKTGV